jgi:phage protein U
MSLSALLTIISPPPLCPLSDGTTEQKGMHVLNVLNEQNDTIRRIDRGVRT